MKETHKTSITIHELPLGLQESIKYAINDIHFKEDLPHKILTNTIRIQYEFQTE